MKIGFSLLLLLLLPVSPLRYNSSERPSERARILYNLTLPPPNAPFA